MHIGEDIPALIPLSVTITILLIFMLSSVSSFSLVGKEETIHQKNVIFVKMLKEYGNEFGEIESPKRKFNSVSYLNLSSGYYKEIILEKNQSNWIWKTYGKKAEEYLFNFNYDVVIDGELGEMVIKVGK